MRVWDADAHVEESEATFADPYWDPALKHRRPQVVQTGWGIHWLIDGELRVPWVRNGRLGRVFGTPQSINGQRVNSYFHKPESLECLELRGANDRLKFMDQENIAIQFIYPTMSLAWPLSDDPVMRAAICRSYNSWIADVCDNSGGRLKWVATIDPSEPKVAADEMIRSKDLGASGTMLQGMVWDQCITAPPFEAIWGTAAQLDMSLAVHVHDCTPLGQETFHYSMMMAFKGLMFSGLLDRYPSLRVAFLEAGCHWIPFVADRIEEAIHPQRLTSAEDIVNILHGRLGYKSQLTPDEYIERGNIYFGFEVEQELLPWCLDKYGAAHFLYGSDIPHADYLPGSINHFLGRKDISEEAKRTILVDNCARFYGLPVPELTPA